jgi:hypothetical protein
MPGRTRRCHVPPDAARTIAALLALRGRVIAPILAGIRSLRIGRDPRTWIAVGRGYENLRTGAQTLLLHGGIAARPQPHGRHCAGQRTASRLAGRDRQFPWRR